MEYKSQKVEQAKAMVAESERRILRQRRRVEKLLYDGQPTDEAQAQLLIMEESLIEMTRFLAALLKGIDG
jgi:hypothetical protein